MGLSSWHAWAGCGDYAVFEECFDALNEQEQRDFVSLLECDDPDLFTWVMGHGRSENLGHAAMVDKIVAHNLSKVR